MGARSFEFDRWASAEARSGWRAAAALLIEHSDTIREAVDLSRLHVFVGDEYRISEKHGFIYIPWNLTAETIPARMQHLIMGGRSHKEGFAGGHKSHKGEGLRRS